MSEVERLRDRVKELEAVLGVDLSQVAMIRRAFPKMEPDVARILGMLVKREFVTKASLYTVMYCGKPECEWPAEKVLDVQICRLRKHLDAIGVVIQTARGEGWHIAKPDKAKIRAVIDGAPQLDLEATAIAAEQKSRRVAFLYGGA